MNKDIETTEYVNKLKDLKLSESSRARIQSELLEHARFHGVRVAEDGRSIGQVPQRTSLFNLFKQPKSMTAAIIAIALIAGGGTSYAAEGAVPGDFLYTVKTEVNENIKSALAVSNESEARLQARLAEERLEEAEELAARGELTAEVSADISSRLKRHYDDAESRSDKAEAAGDFETSSSVRASLEGSFRVYAEVLTDLNARVSGNDGASLITDIRTKADATADAQARSTTTLETSVNAKATTEATIARTDNLISSVEAKLARAESKLSVEAKSRLQARLAEAVSVQAEAKASFRAETYRAAYTSAQAAARIATEVDAMINSALRLEVDVNITTDRVIDRQGMIVENEAQSDNSNNKVELNVDTSIDTDTRVDTDVIEVDAQSDTSVRSGLSL